MPDNEVLATGTVIARETTPGSGTYTTIPGVFNITAPQRTREETVVNDLADTEVRVKMGIRDNGEITIQYNLLAGNAPQAALKTSFDAGDLLKYRITYPGTLGTDTFEAYVKALTRDPVAINGRLTRTAVLRISGAVTEA